MNTEQTSPTPLPIKQGLTPITVISLIIAVIMAVASIAGLLAQTAVYPRDELIESFVPNDVVNLAVGLPTLLGSIWLTRRGKLIGLLFWPGALFFVFYTYIVYLLAMPLGLPLLLHLALVVLSAYSLITLLPRIDAAAVQGQLAGRVSEKIGGGVLIGLGVLFLVRVVAIFAGALMDGTSLARTEVALNIADLLISPVTIAGGLLLWRRRPRGYVAGLGLLFQLSMLFIGLIAFMIIRPFITDAQFVLGDLLVILVMGLVAFVPFGLFVRGFNPRA